MTSQQPVEFLPSVFGRPSRREERCLAVIVTWVESLSPSLYSSSAGQIKYTSVERVDLCVQCWCACRACRACRAAPSVCPPWRESGAVLAWPGLQASLETLQSPGHGRGVDGVY